MRLAYLSPLPPERTGVADYSMALLPELASRESVELEVFTSREAYRSQATLRSQAPARHSVPPPLRLYDDLPARHAERPFDVIVYQMGNSPFHLEIRELALRFPGLVVLHEFVLHHLVREATQGRGDSAAYVEEMRYCYGETGEKIARLALDPDFPLDLFAFPLFERLVDRSLGVLVHNQAMHARVLASRSDALLGVVPSPIDLKSVTKGRRPAEARERLGIDSRAFVAGTFGLVTPAKRLEPTLRAFRLLRKERLEARLVIAGEISPYYDVNALLGSELGDGVVVTGRLDERAFLDTMAAVDVGINLRYPTAGETSYALLWLLALERPVLVTAQGPAGEMPQEIVIPIPIDGTEELWLLEALRTLAAEPETRALRGQRARSWVEEHHSPRLAVDGYLALVGRARETKVCEAVPPLAPFPKDDIETRVIAQVAAGLLDLGVGGSDRQTIRSVAAERMKELGWLEGET